MTTTFSLVINHTPWVPERVRAMAEMRRTLAVNELDELPLMFNDTDYRGTDWQQSKVQWALDQWRWASKQDVTHHVFMTDDLHIAPRFWDILGAMVANTGDNPIGLLSNHPRAFGGSGRSCGYRTNSWLVGPAYVLPHDFLVRFLAWFEALPDGPHTTFGTKAYRNDDSSINEFVTQSGSWTFHPMPTIIEHRGDIGSTVGHGDKYSRERLSWRASRHYDDERQEWLNFHHTELAVESIIRNISDPSYWDGASVTTLLKVGNE